jgi:hypothetical protein
MRESCARNRKSTINADFVYGSSISKAKTGKAGFRSSDIRCGIRLQSLPLVQWIGRKKRSDSRQVKWGWRCHYEIRVYKLGEGSEEKQQLEICGGALELGVAGSKCTRTLILDVSLSNHHRIYNAVNTNFSYLIIAFRF